MYCDPDDMMVSGLRTSFDQVLIDEQEFDDYDEEVMESGIFAGYEETGDDYGYDDDSEDYLDDDYFDDEDDDDYFDDDYYGDEDEDDEDY